MNIQILKRVHRANYSLDVNGKCLICGKKFDSEQCSHSISDNKLAIEQAEREKLLI